jgi:ATP-dependent Clp protease ATP-binding subunit ClpC
VRRFNLPKRLLLLKFLSGDEIFMDIEGAQELSVKVNKAEEPTKQ